MKELPFLDAFNAGFKAIEIMMYCFMVSGFIMEGMFLRLGVEGWTTPYAYYFIIALCTTANIFSVVFLIFFRSKMTNF